MSALTRTTKQRLLKMKPNVYLHGKKIDRSNGKEGAERDLADWIVGRHLRHEAVL